MKKGVGSWRLMRYLCGLFFSRIFVLALLVVVFTLLFEFIEVHKRGHETLALSHQLYLSSLKIPLILSQFLPFIVLLSALLLTWRLMRYSEMTAFRSAGLSFVQFSIPLLGVAALLGLFDLYVLSPSAFHLLEKREISTGNATPGISQDLWVRNEAPDGGEIIFHIKDLQGERAGRTSILIFSPTFRLMESYEAESTILSRTSADLTNGWIIKPNTTPLKFSSHNIPFAFDLTKTLIRKENKDPRLQPFCEIDDILSSSKSVTRCHIVRWHYLLAHSAWIVSLTLLAIAFGLSSRRRMYAFLWSVGGVVASFGLYFCKECLYASGLAHPTLPLIFVAWLPVFLTLLLAVTIIFEKNEF